MTTDFRALGIGDSHIEEGARFDECVRVHDAFADLVERERPHAVFHAGDIYDRASTPAERLYAADFFRRCADVSPVVIAKGNHDRVLDLSIFAGIKAHHRIAVLETWGVTSINFDGMQAHVGVMAWPTRASALDEEGSRQAVRNTLMGMGELLHRRSGPKVLLGHFDISGATVGKRGQPLIGGALTVTLADLALVRADVTVAGHIHKAQDWTYDGHPIVYTGSPYRTDAGEDEAKSFLSLSLTEGRVTWMRVPSPARDWHLFEGVWTREELCEDGSPKAGWSSLEAAGTVKGADIRFHYTSTSEEQDAADVAADQLKERWMAEGAATVKLDPEILAHTRSRVPEVSSAVTIEDKLDVLWKSTDRTPEPPARTRIFGRLALLQQKGGRQWHSSALCYNRVRGKGLGVFREEFDIDLASIPGQAVAVTGPNGAGKSTFVELLTGVVDRDMPTRGSLVDLAALAEDREAFLEAQVVNGQAWTVRHDLDGVSGKSEASMTRPDGTHALEDRKVTTFDLVSKKTFPPPEVRMASTVRAQKARGFLDLKPSERRSIVLRAKGVEWLESLAKQARQLAADAKGKLDTTEARLRDERRRIGVLSDTLTFPVSKGRTLDEAVEDAVGLASVAASDLAAIEVVARDAQARLDWTRAEAERAKGANAARDRILTERAMADLAFTNAERDLVVAKAGLIAAQGAIEGLDEARAAAARIAMLTEETSADRAKIAELPLAALEQERSAAVAAGKAAQRQVASYANAIGAAKAHLQEIEKLTAERDSLAGADDRYEAAFRAAETTKAKLDETKAEQLSAAEDRIDGLREHLSGIADRQWDDPIQAATHGLLADDAKVEAQKERPDTIARLTRKLAELTAEARRLGTHNIRLVQVRTRLDALANQPSRLSEMEAELAALNASIAESDAKASEAGRKLEEAERARQAITDAMGVRFREIRGLEPMAARVAQATEAEKRLAVCEEAVKRTAGAVEEAMSARKALASDPVPDPVTPPDVLGADAIVRNANRQVSDAKVALALREKERDETTAAAERIRGLETEHESLALDLSDWTRLGGDLGKDGLQNMEADAAGPQITDLANELLHTCHGPRWTVAIETQRADSKGERMIEGFHVRVFDSEEVREVDGECLSGGQKAIVDEALSLALAIHSCHGTTGATLVRDESGSALDPENGRAYVRMLRRAGARMQASKILFVSHDRDMAAMADARLEVADGRITVACS